MNFKKLNKEREDIWSKSRTASDSNNDLVLFFYDHFSGEPHLLWPLTVLLSRDSPTHVFLFGDWELGTI